jgi:hypothetical protein
MDNNNYSHHAITIAYTSTVLISWQALFKVLSGYSNSFTHNNLVRQALQAEHL